MEYMSYDWKKAASQAAVNAAQLEVAFMELSYSLISQKAGKFLEDPYRLGFEIVYSNDDNSKMAGLFAFRAGSELFSVPCFFITGEVKGTELLYQHGVKMFCPFNSKWTEYLIAKHEKAVEGSNHPKDMTNRMINGMQLDRLANPFHSKMASDVKAAWEELFQEMDKTASTVESIQTPGLLRDFLVHEDTAMEKLAKAIDISFPFAEAVAHLPEEVWAPSLTEDEVQEMQKSAFEKLRCDFTLLKDNFGCVKSASEKEIYNAHKRGWSLTDNRPEMQPETKCVAYEENLGEVDQVGFFDILCTDMEYRKVFVGYEMPSYEYRPDPYCSIGLRTDKNHEKVVIFCDKNYYRECRYQDLVGQPCDDTSSKWTDSEEFVETPSTGGYVAVDTQTGDITCPFVVNSVKTREDGVVILKVQRLRSSIEEEWLINKDYSQTCWARYGNKGDTTIFGASIKFHKVAVESDKDYHDCCTSIDSNSVATKNKYYKVTDCPYTPGAKEIFWAYLRNAGAKKVTLELKDTDEVCNTYDVNINGVPAAVTDPAVLTVKLASQLGIHVSEALDIVDSLQPNTPFSFLSFGDKEHIKTSASIRIVDEPNFTSDFDSDLGVARDTTQRFVLDSETTQPTPPQARYGDGYDPTGGNRGNMLTQAAKDAGFDDSMLFSKSPEELASMAQQGGVASLVDPGIVGMLLSTYNSATMVMKYIPKLLEGLDHFGRLLFLFRWKPADFEKMYGSDDMSNLEDNLVSQFLSQGDIVLELIERSSDKATGSAPF